MTTVVIGVGNRFRNDDGAGPVLLERLEERLDKRPAGSEAAGIETCELDGEASRIVDAWTDAALAIVIDASGIGGEPGRVRHIAAKGPGGEAGGALDAGLATRRLASTHGLGVSDAIELATVLGRMPSRLVVYAIEGADFSEGSELSPEVDRAIDHVLDCVLSDLAAT